MTKIQNPLDRCDFKQKFNALWHRAYSAIRFINGKGVEDGEGSVTLTAEDLPDVQPLLTAGENITIEDNVISATGGSSAPVWGNITGDIDDQTDLKDALDDKATVSSVESIEDEIGAVGQAGTIRNDISLVNDRMDSVEDEIGPETTAGTLRYKIKENSNDIVSIENEIDIIDGIIAAHATAINDKSDKTYVDAHISDTSNPHMVSKAQVGLGNVDNTSDAAKPISTATQTALNARVQMLVATRTLTNLPNNNLTSYTITHNLNIPTKNQHIDVNITAPDQYFSHCFIVVSKAVNSYTVSVWVEGISGSVPKITIDSCIFYHN